MSARDDYPAREGLTTHVIQSHTYNDAMDEIDVLRAGLENVRSLNSGLMDAVERRNIECKAWMNGVADFVEQFGFDREAACGPADLLPGLRSAQDQIDRLTAEVAKFHALCVGCEAVVV